MNSIKRFQGIDVSEWQGRIDFSRVRNSGIRIVYIKATQGTDYVDPYFEQNYRDADKEGLAIGFYHYVTARTVSDAEEQARYFASYIRGKHQRARPVMDFETFGKLTRPEIHEIALCFLTALEAETSHIPAIYSDSYNASTNFADDRLRRYPLWIAEYDVTRPDMENLWSSWSGWQYTDRGTVDGINGEVDRDYFRHTILLDASATDDGTKYC